MCWAAETLDTKSAKMCAGTLGGLQQNNMSDKERSIFYKIITLIDKSGDFLVIFLQNIVKNLDHSSVKRVKVKPAPHWQTLMDSGRPRERKTMGTRAEGCRVKVWPELRRRHWSTSLLCTQTGIQRAHHLVYLILAGAVSADLTWTSLQTLLVPALIDLNCKLSPVTSDTFYGSRTTTLSIVCSTIDRLCNEVHGCWITPEDETITAAETAAGARPTQQPLSSITRQKMIHDMTEMNYWSAQGESACSTWPSEGQRHSYQCVWELSAPEHLMDQTHHSCMNSTLRDAGVPATLLALTTQYLQCVTWSSNCLIVVEIGFIDL